MGLFFSVLVLVSYLFPAFDSVAPGRLVVEGKVDNGHDVLAGRGDDGLPSCDRVPCDLWDVRVTAGKILIGNVDICGGEGMTFADTILDFLTGVIDFTLGLTYFLVIADFRYRCTNDEFLVGVVSFWAGVIIFADILAGVISYNFCGGVRVIGFSDIAEFGQPGTTDIAGGVDLLTGVILSSGTVDTIFVDLLAGVISDIFWGKT